MQKEPTKKAAGKRNAGANPPRKLSRVEKKQIAEVIRQAKGDGKAHTAQQTIPYLTMYPDGICKVSEKKYSKSIAFEDINYQLAQADDKTAIFENWCDFLNYFDASVSVQLSFINQGTQREQAEKAINIPAQDDAFNSIRTEYSDMLKNQLSKGNNGLVKHKYITFSIEADNPAAAKARLSRIETDVLNNFKVLGASARPMTGYERLNVLHGVFHPEGEPFRFDFSWLAPSGLSTKDFIAPSSFHFGEGRYFRMGRKIGAVSFLEILAPELNDRMLADILDLETGVIINLHIRSIDQTEAIKTIKRKITDLDKMKIEEQKKAVRSGYDMDIIPSDLATFGNEAKNLLQDLQSRNERMFLLTFLVVNMADTKRKLENDIFAAAGIAQKYNCALTRLDYQQEAGLMSSIPLGENLIPIQRGLTTSSTAISASWVSSQFGKLLEDLNMPHIRFHDLRHTAATNMHQLTGDFYTVGEVLGHTLAGIGVSLGLSMNFEAVTARYVDVRLERKKEVLDAYHGAVKQADPAKAEKAEPKKAKSAAKKKSSDLEL